MDHPACRNLAERRARENAQQRPSSSSESGNVRTAYKTILFSWVQLILPKICNKVITEVTNIWLISSRIQLLARIYSLSMINLSTREGGLLTYMWPVYLVSTISSVYRIYKCGNFAFHVFGQGQSLCLLTTFICFLTFFIFRFSVGYPRT